MNVDKTKYKNSVNYDIGYNEKVEYHKMPMHSRYFSLWHEIFQLLKKHKKKKGIKRVKILDLGCGTGQFGHMALSRGYRYIGGR